ncbi:Acg family FMN-binding oxidoreductase [Luedemannella helvata]|uniref:NAD(P)H nitroreductase n=1 Tax=Luedemannella helvata TaxID=349315 RepID=A0ABN2L2X2_9ACTN
MTDNHDDGAAALVHAAATAGHAPSIHNTQPWRWHVRPGTLDLHAERDRQLGVTDPDGRLLTISCGTALHHALVALAAEGWAATVDRFPDGNPDHLARITLTGPQPVTAEAVRHAQTIQLRHTDRRPVTDTPVEAAALDAIAKTAAEYGVNCHYLRPDQVVELASVASRAQAAEGLDDDWRAELAIWAGAALGAGIPDVGAAGRPAGTGVPADVVPETAPQTTVPGRDFGQPGTLPIDAGHDLAASYAILYGREDGPDDWLRAGEALSAAWLTATELGVSVVPMSAAVEIDVTRAELRRLLAGIGYPYLALRLGIPDPDHAGPPHTPRLPAEQTITFDEP